MIKKMKLYGPFLLGLVLLLIIAAFLPQIVFQIQDGYSLTTSTVEKWEKSHKELVNADYEKDMGKRIYSLIEKDVDDLTISAISYGGKNAETIVDMLERIFAGEWMRMINDMTLALYCDFLQETSTVNIQDCKKYVVYENSSLEKILLLVWYLDIYMVDYDTTVRLLVDAETENVYYIRIIGEGEEKQENKKVPLEMYSQDMFGIVNYFQDVIYSFYDADVDTYNNMVWNKYEDGRGVFLDLYYGELNTSYEICVQAGKNGYPDYSSGVIFIRDLVPEMIQN